MINQPNSQPVAAHSRFDGLMGCRNWRSASAQAAPAPDPHPVRLTLAHGQPRFAEMGLDHRRTDLSTPPPGSRDITKSLCRSRVAAGYACHRRWRKHTKPFAQPYR